MEWRTIAGWMLASMIGAGCSTNAASQPETTVATDGGSTEGSSTGEDASGETTTSPGSSSGSTGVAACDPTPRFDVQFAQTGEDPAFTSLDVLVDGEQAGQPIVIWVHGGGWVGGDKGSHTMNPAFAAYFASRGEVLVPINYRLVGDPEGTTFAEQAQDIASAIAWVAQHAEEFCGDADRIHLIGYSAGAHLVALVATDTSYLQAHGLHPEDLATVVSLDVNAYDIPWAIENAVLHDYPLAVMNLPAVFGDDLESQLAASPMTHIQAGSVPPSLVISAPDKNGVIQSLSRAASERYVDALTDAENEAVFFEAVDDSHSSLAMDFGVPGDVVTGVVEAFRDEH